MTNVCCNRLKINKRLVEGSFKLFLDGRFAIFADLLRRSPGRTWTVMVHVRALAGGLVEIACQSCTGVGYGLAGGTQAEVTLVGGAGVGAGVSELQPAWLSVASWKIYQKRTGGSQCHFQAWTRSNGAPLGVPSDLESWTFPGCHRQLVPGDQNESPRQAKSQRTLFLREIRIGTSFKLAL